MTSNCRIFIRKSGAAFVTGALAVLLIAAGAAAQTQNTTMGGMKLSSDKPIQIESDQLEIHDQEHTALFTGNVKVVQGTTTLQAGQMTVFYRQKEAPADGTQAAAQPAQPAPSISSGNADIERILVSEKVFLNSGTQTATADNGEFNMDAQTFILKSNDKNNVVLSDGPNVFTGCQLTVFMETGQAKLESCGGRVQIQLDPQSQKQQQQKQN